MSNNYAKSDLHINLDISKFVFFTLTSDIGQTKYNYLCLDYVFTDEEFSLICEDNNNFEPGNNTFYKFACAPSEYSDQPVHLRRLIRVYTVRLKRFGSLVWYP